jgi:ABC-2 type transport system permease protein
LNTQSSTLPQSFEQQTVTPATFSAARRMYWSVRRELWESRSIYLAPLAVAAAFLFGFLISTIRLPARMRALSALDPTHRHDAIATPYDAIAGVMMLTAMVVGAFYCLDALQGERHDRSILFWKSMPVSDLVTVLSKASIPFLVLPLLTFAITVALQWLMLLISTAVLWATGLNPATLWRELLLPQVSVLVLYHLITVHVLWHAPIYSWLLLVSAWARRAAFLWAALPLLAVGLIEKGVFNTSHLAAILMYRLSGGAEAMTMPDTFPTNPMTHLTPGAFLSSPGLWTGLLFSALCLAPAIRLRRYRMPV